MSVAFPYPVKIVSSTPSIEGLRYADFTNIDGETFAKPSLNGFWRISMSVIATDMQEKLALSAFRTAMSAAGATCIVPVYTQIRPDDGNGRMLADNGVSQAYTFDHTGFIGDPFDGFTLRSSASHRDSYVDITKPKLSHLWAGHYITLDDRLYQVVSVSAINESETAVRISVVPNIRGNHDSGKTVVVDQLRLKCRMESGDSIGATTSPIASASLSFIEAF